MIRLCKNLFYKPKYGSDADSIMLKRLFSTVTVVLMCLAAISFSAYAFFSCSVTSGTNTIQSSSFSSSVTIKTGNGETITEGKLQSYLFNPGEYIVTVNTDSGTTGTGFYIVSVNGAKYYTQQLGKDLNAPSQERTEISFALDVKAITIVAFESRWGTTSCYSSQSKTEFYIKNSQPLMVIAIGAAENVTANPKDTTPETTVPEGTTSPTEPGEVVHVVAPDEYLSTIASIYGTNHTRIAAYNGIPGPYVIHPGQKILIPPTDWVEPAAPTEVVE